MRIGIAFTVLVAISLFCAGQSCGIVMGPARFEVSLPPGEIAEGDYYVQNDTDQNARIFVEPENWFKEVYDYGKLDIKDWIEFDTYEFDLKPKEIKKLRLRIKVPRDVKGELVAQIFFTSSVLREDGQASAEGIKARVGGVLYVAIKGTEIVKADIANVAISKDLGQGTESLRVEVAVKNKGNVHLRPTGKVKIENESGEKLTELDLALGSPALPGQEISYNALWDKPELKSGKYNITVNVNYGKEINMEKSIKLKKALEVSEDGKVIIR